MLNIGIDSLNAMNINLFLRGIDTRLRDLSEFWSDYVQPYTYDRIGDIFDSEGDGRWAALNPQYAARKAITHPGQPILRRDDAYYRAATSDSHTDSVANIDPLALVLGVETEYAQYHEEGRGVPTRQVYHLIPLTLGFTTDLTRMAERYQQDVINRLERQLR